jgi:microcystin degradation protein MlrC
VEKRVLLAGLSHETHTFVQGLTRLTDFTVMCGEEMWQVEGGTSNLAGVLEVARAGAWDVIPVVLMRAIPGPLVADEVVERFWAAFREAAEREIPRGVDGVYFVLHGAMVSQSFPDVEGELLRRVRDLEGLSGAPLCGVLDLHCNFSAAMARYSDGLVSYRCNPHTDSREASMDAARLLDRLMCAGERAVTVWAHPPLMWPPSGTGTRSEPMRTLEARAREIERTHPDILVVNVFGGFAFADIPEVGVSFSAVTLGDPEGAHSVVKELRALALSQREVGNRIGMSLDEALERLNGHPEGPVILVEPSDNIGGGAPGDNTCILRVLVERGVRDAGVIVNDPETVQMLEKTPLGDRVSVTIGGKSGALGAEPLPLEVELLSRSDGRFQLEDRHSHLASGGEYVNMGPCAVVRHGGVRILLTSRATPPFDLGQWRSQGIDPEKLFAIGVKAAVGHRQAYDPIAVASYTVDTPGPCAENLRRLPYHHVKRPIYPLDELVAE